MKRILAMMLAVMLLVSLAACENNTGNSGTDETTTAATGESASGTTETTGGDEKPADVYSFSVDKGAVTPGEAFDPFILPEPVNTYTIPSCAFSGTDNVYNYGSYEIIAYNEGNGEVVYSVYFIDPTVKTTEGLSVGDEESKVTAVYGAADVDNGNQKIYQKGNTQLIILIADGMVLSIEYRLVTE